MGPVLVPAQEYMDERTRHTRCFGFARTCRAARAASHTESVITGGNVTDTNLADANLADANLADANAGTSVASLELVRLDGCHGR